MIDIIKSFAWIISFVLTVYASYFVLVSLFSFLPLKKAEKSEPKYKFAAIVAARNEELVIGNLIDSLQNQKYPKELFDIFVILNNCTDGTKQIASSKGVTIYDCIGTIKSKGDALCEFFDYILGKGDCYDSFCIFDADNIVHEDFLREMNHAICRGVRVGQGYRDSKNPQDSIISNCYSVYYCMVNRFYNRARNAMKLSAIISGCGYMVCTDVIREQGGWHTKTLTEDTEFTTKCVLSGERVQWIPDAVIYDEQPITFAQSWRQRKRWSTGTIQCFELYFARLIKNMFTKRSVSCFDLNMFLIAPYMQILYLISVILTIILNLSYVGYAYFPKTDIFYRLFLSLDFSYFVCVASALLAILLERKKISKMLKGIIAFWFFILSWLPINIICVIKKQTEWTPIKHTRDIKIDEMPSEKNKK